MSVGSVVTVIMRVPVLSPQLHWEKFYFLFKLVAKAYQSAMPPSKCLQLVHVLSTNQRCET